MQDAHLAEAQQSLRRRQRQNQQSERGENFNCCVDRKSGWRYYKDRHGETRRQHLHLQRRSGQLHCGKRVGAHGKLHHLRDGGDFGFLEKISEHNTA